MKYLIYFQVDGNIVTVHFDDKKQGIYDRKTGNIGINHFLNRITPTLTHECTHKIGYEVADDSFGFLNPVVREAGTELVSVRALSFGREGREIVEDGLAAKLPIMTSTDFLDVSLVSQLDYLLGNQELDRTILKGKDFFTPALVEKYGEEKTVYILELLNDISRFSKNEKKFNSLVQSVKEFQSCLLDMEFSKRLDSLTSLTEGIEFLEDLLKFGDERIKRREKEDSIRYTDKEFEEYFKHCKEQIEKQFGKTEIEYFESEWERKYPFKPMLEDISNQEKNDILELSVKFSKVYRKNSLLNKILNKNRKKDIKSLSSGEYDDNSNVMNMINKYKVDTDILLPKKSKENVNEKDIVQSEDKNPNIV